VAADPAPVWTVHNPIAAAVLDGIFWLGWVVLVASTFLLNHFELFGLSQVFARLFGKQLSEAKFRAPLLYRRVRHPIYLGVLLAVWATPAMTVGHLLFSVVITGYILIGIQLEEHDLIELFATISPLSPAGGHAHSASGPQHRRSDRHQPLAQGVCRGGSMSQRDAVQHEQRRTGQPQAERSELQPRG